MEEIKWHLVHVHWLLIMVFFNKSIILFDIMNHVDVHIQHWPCRKEGSNWFSVVVVVELWLFDRYIQYLCDLSLGSIERPHFTELILKTINLAPVPLFNRDRFESTRFSSIEMFERMVVVNRNSCRPFVDVYNQDQKKIFSTYQDPNKLRWDKKTIFSFLFYKQISVV